MVSSIQLPSTEAVANFLSDYVVEQHLIETNGWKYRVWKSGLVELWGRFEKTIEFVTQPWIEPLPFNLEEVSVTASTSNLGNTDAYVGHCGVQNNSTDIWTKANQPGTVARLFVYLTGFKSELDTESNGA